MIVFDAERRTARSSWRSELQGDGLRLGVGARGDVGREAASAGALCCALRYVFHPRLGFNKHVIDRVLPFQLTDERASIARNRNWHQVDRFRAGDAWTLVATDLMARGMDFVGVGTVVNYDFPGVAARVRAPDRAERAERARPGAAVTLFTEEDAGARGPARDRERDEEQRGATSRTGCCSTRGASDRRGVRRRKKRKDGREDNPRREAIDPRVAANAAAAATAAAARRREKGRAEAKKRRAEKKASSSEKPKPKPK